MNYRPEPLTTEAFHPFGQVLDGNGGDGLQPITGAFECSLAEIDPKISLLRVPRATELPFQIRRLERHPHSAQTFLPLGGDVGFVVVCLNSPNGDPALDTLRVFLSSPGQILTYRRGVWHHGILPREAPARLAMAMVHSADGADTEFFSVPTQKVMMIV